MLSIYNMKKQNNYDGRNFCQDENEYNCVNNEDEALKGNGMKLNNLEQRPEPYLDGPSRRKSTIESLRNFCKRRATIRVIYYLFAAVFIAISISLICLFVPMSNEHEKISAHLEKTSLLVEDCRQHSDFLRNQNQGLQNKLDASEGKLVKISNEHQTISAHLEKTSLLHEDCQKNSDFVRSQNEDLQKKLQAAEENLIKLREVLDDKSKHLETAITLSKSLQQQIFDLNAKIMAQTEQIGQSGQTQVRKTSGVLGWLGLFSTGWSVVPSKTVFAATSTLLLLNIIVR